MSDLTCPCGSGRRYRDCCQPLHDGAPAADAEALMRSRYTAYVMQLDDYLQRSWHPSTRPPPPTDTANTRWLGLQVRKHTRIDQQHAEVEFVARYKIAGRAYRLHETSRFVYGNGNWLYVDGRFGQ